MAVSITQKTLRFEYQAKLNVTGLTDVKGQFYLNGVAKAVGANALLFTELDRANSPGLYELLIPAATLTSWGVAVGQTNTIEGYINSASDPYPVPVKEELTIANLDDIQALLGVPSSTAGTIAGDIAALSAKVGTPAGSSTSADIAAVKSDTAAIKADLETGSASLSTILSAVQTLQNASIGAGIGVVLPIMSIPGSGSQAYKIPITVLNDAGALVDPASQIVNVAVQNGAGTDRGSYLTGSTGSPATVTATRTSTGQYYAMVSIPSGVPEEELVFSFSYTLNGNATVRYGTSLLQNDVATAGYALQSTLVATQSTVNAINATVSNATYGNSAIQALLANATYGLSAQQQLEAAIQSLLTNSTYGLSALQNIVANNQSLLTNNTYGLSALQALQTATQGTGFTAGADDLHSLSNYIRNQLGQGGKAV